MMEYAEKGDLRQHMIGMTEQRARDIMALPILQALVVLQKEVRRSPEVDTYCMQCCGFSSSAHIGAPPLAGSRASRPEAR